MRPLADVRYTLPVCSLFNLSMHHWANDNRVSASQSAPRSHVWFLIALLRKHVLVQLKQGANIYMHTMHEQASKAISHKSKTHAHLACHLLVAVSSKADLTMHSRFTLFELDIESSKYPLAVFSCLIGTTIRYACWKTCNQWYKQLLMLKQLFNTKHKQQTLESGKWYILTQRQHAIGYRSWMCFIARRLAYKYFELYWSYELVHWAWVPFWHNSVVLG